MKSFIKEYLEVCVYVVCGILIIVGSYNIIINIYHSKYLNEKIVVREIDKNYSEYKSNILKIESNLEKYQGNTSLSQALKLALKVLKGNGAYRLLPGDKLGYNEVYNLNDYFIDKVINETWISSLKFLVKDEIVNKYVYVLIDNSNYVNKELLNNSNFHYDVKNNDVRNTLQEEFKMILSNYNHYSYLLLELSGKLGDTDD